MNSTAAETVIVLGCAHCGLAEIRSLGRHGLNVIGLTYNSEEFGLHSRYLKEWHLCPHPTDEEQFIQFLIDQADVWRGALLLETNDYFLLALSKHKARLSQYYKLVSPDWEIAQIFLEKDRTYALADECGVLHPGMYKPQSMEELDALADQLKFPLMIKPILSHEFSHIFREKLVIVKSFEELRSWFRRILDAQQPVILSEIIPGTDYKTLEQVYLYINSKGEIAAECFNIKLRQTPPMYGVMRVGRSMPVNAEVQALTSRLLRHVNYRGIADVEFKRDSRDNQLKLIEVNIRQPRSINVAIASGVDFPWLIYQDLVCDNQLTVTEYNQETYYVEAVADIVDFIRKDEHKDLLALIQPYFARHKAAAIWSWSDPRPFFSDIWVRGLRGFMKLRRHITVKPMVARKPPTS